MDPLSKHINHLAQLIEEMQELAFTHAKRAQQAADTRKRLIMEVGRLPAAHHVRAIVAECFLRIVQGRNSVPIVQGDSYGTVPFVEIPSGRLNEVFFFKIVQIGWIYGIPGEALALRAARKAYLRKGKGSFRSEDRLLRNNGGRVFQLDPQRGSEIWVSARGFEGSLD